MSYDQADPMWEYNTCGCCGHYYSTCVCHLPKYKWVEVAEEMGLDMHEYRDEGEDE